MTTREPWLEAIRSLPDDAIRDAIERLRFIEWLERRVLDADVHSRGWVTQDEIERRVGRWTEGVCAGDDRR